MRHSELRQCDLERIEKARDMARYIVPKETKVLFVSSWEYTYGIENSRGEMDKFLGTIQTIHSVNRNGDSGRFTFGLKNEHWIFDESMVEEIFVDGVYEETQYDMENASDLF